MYNTRTLELAQLNGAHSLLINVISYTCAFHVIMSAAKTFCSPHARSGCVTMMLKSNTSCKAVLYCPLWWKLSMMMSVMSQCPGVRLCVTAARWEMKSFEVSKNRHFMGVLNSFTVHVLNFVLLLFGLSSCLSVAISPEHSCCELCF